MLDRVAKPDTRQTLLAVGEQGVAGGTNFLTTVVIGRWCGREELGIFGLGLTIIYLVSATQDSIITTPYTVFVARMDRSDKAVYRGSVMLCHLAFSGLFAFLLLIATLVSIGVGAAQEYLTVLAALCLAVPCWLLREFARRTAYAEFDLRSCLSTTLVMGVVQTIAVVGLLAAGRLSPTSGFCAVALANFAAGMTWWVQSRGMIEFSFVSLKQTLSKHWVMGKLMFAGQIVHTMGSQTIPWLIAVFLGTTTTGVFIACDQVIRFANPVIVGFMNVLTPRSAHAFAADGQAGMHEVVKRATVGIGLFMALFCAAVFTFGDTILATLFGGPFAAYAGVLLLLSISQAIESIAIAPSRGLIVMERVIDGLKAGIVRFVVTLITTLVLIRPYGVYGAAYGVLTGGSMFTIVMVGLYWKAANSRGTPAK